MTNILQKIYLQVDADGERPDDFKGLAGVTWSSNRLFDTDIEYVLADEKAFLAVAQYRETMEGDEVDWNAIHEKMCDILFEANGTGSGADDIVEYMKGLFLPTPDSEVKRLRDELDGMYSLNREGWANSEKYEKQKDKLTEENKRLRDALNRVDELMPNGFYHQIKKIISEALNPQQ